jgi:RNA polymerase sigma-70 factor, ECF subfamily
MDLNNEQIFELLKQISEGNERAMAQLYRSFSRKIYAYAFNRIHDSGKAEEIMVDTMYEVWKHPLGFRGDAKFSTWVIGIARHKMLDSLRKNEPESDEIDDSLVSEDIGVFDLLAEKQRREGVQQCMGKLSDEHRECLHLVFYEGMTLSEIAEIQNCPENTIKTRVFHARQRIKNCLRLFIESEH